VQSRRSSKTRPMSLLWTFPHAPVFAPAVFMPVVMFNTTSRPNLPRHAEVAEKPSQTAIWRDQTARMERYEQDILSSLRQSWPSRIATGAFRAEYGVAGLCDSDSVTSLLHLRGEPVSGRRSGWNRGIHRSMDWMANVDGVAFFMDEAARISRARLRALLIVAAAQTGFWSSGSRASLTGSSPFRRRCTALRAQCAVYVIPFGSRGTPSSLRAGDGCPGVDADRLRGLPVERDRLPGG